MGLLGLATASATYLQGALSVLSTYLVDEFGLSPAEFGLAFTIFSVVGALGSPGVGTLVDVSPRRVIAGLFVSSFAGILMVASAPSYPWILLASAVAGLAMASSNPVTNKIVSSELPVARHGLVIGIKQAGPPMGLFAAGLVLPFAAAGLGWRWALASTALLPLFGLVAIGRLVADESKETASGRVEPEGRRGGWGTVWWLATIGFTRAVGGGAVIAFLPLFAHEDLGYSPAVAGLLASLAGLAGVVGRVTWGARAARFRDPVAPLTVLAALALASSATIWAALLAPWLVWVGVLGAGFSILAWLAVSWIALLRAVDPADVGRSTGVIQLATSGGIAAGPLVMGLVVDATGSYGWGWGCITGAFAVTFVLTALWGRTVGVGARAT